jgi:hypothetical protein
LKGSGLAASSVLAFFSGPVAFLSTSSKGTHFPSFSYCYLFFKINFPLNAAGDLIANRTGAVVVTGGRTGDGAAFLDAPH